MSTPVRLTPPLRFTSLRSRLFAAFVGVLVLSLLLTGAIFWLQIRVLNTQRVRADLLSAAPLVKTNVNTELVRYWQTTQPSPETMLADLSRLKSSLVSIARNDAVRIILTDYCNNIAIDTAAKGPLESVAALHLPATCAQVLDDTTGGTHPQPVSLNIGLNANHVRQVQQTDLPGTGSTFYLAFPPPPFFSSQVQGGTYPLLVRTIIIAKSTTNAGQDALSTILPRLAAAGIFALVLTLLVVALIVRAIIRPLRTITAASERMTQGDYDQRVPDAGEDEVGQLSRSFNRMANEVSRAREHQRQFIANVSHDLKTPLTSILGFSQILLEKGDPGATGIQRRAAQVINEEARRLQRLTIDLLDLSRLEAGQLPMRFAECDLRELAGQAMLRYSELPDNSAITFLDQREPGPMPVHGDADRLMQVLVNLLDNAVKFCGPSGSVALTAGVRDGRVNLTVANTGQRISAEDLARVFQRFYRADHSRAMRTGGAGIGLAIVREIITAHGGAVEAHSGGDGWTRFTIVLPAGGKKAV